MHHLICQFSYFPISSYLLVAQNVLSDEPMLCNNSSTENHMINHTCCCNCIKTLLPVLPLATSQGVAGGGGALLTAVTGGSLTAGSVANT